MSGNPLSNSTHSSSACSTFVCCATPHSIAEAGYCMGLYTARSLSYTVAWLDRETFVRQLKAWKKLGCFSRSVNHGAEVQYAHLFCKRVGVGTFGFAIVFWQKSFHKEDKTLTKETKLERTFSIGIKIKGLANYWAQCAKTWNLATTAAWKKKFEKPFFGNALSEDVCKLIIRFHEVEFNHSIFHLLSNEMVPYVDVFRVRVLDVVTAKSNSTFVITVQRNFIEVKSVVFELGSHPKGFVHSIRDNGDVFSSVCDIAELR
ncbi:hypothetical protein Tco_0410074 [Tanacetum coccineum]